MLNIFKNKFAYFIVIFTMITIPIASAKYISYEYLEDSARVALYDVEVLLPNGWEWTETNEIVFTQPGNILSIDIPFTVINNSEVAVKCSFVAVEQLSGKRVEFDTIYIPVDSDVVYEMEIPEDALIGDTNFRIEMNLEQID